MNGEVEAAGPAVPVTVLIYTLAAITYCVLGDGRGAVCGVLAEIAAKDRQPTVKPSAPGTPMPR
ncbi:hypothetical protein A5724_00405 [Mycobacterium sp. ACS1612]|uniref:hypothetical protein n=1 Tax=Mycobacterium sp. ACS1612 TaxID=1834117 RepID=UPI0008019CDB|nr:hypothetical protein [Mycobacterium sp. ACS1612]OBF42231.1 hypothetical protein A5724_00405 [Mycobacterium sp. ACS1612]